MRYGIIFVNFSGETMPIYEYRCSGCGHETEVLQKMSDAPLTDCPSCGKPALTKLISAAGFQLKGSGWYVTDFRGGSKPKTDPAGKGDEAAKGDASAKGDGSAKGEAKSGDKSGDKATSGTGEGGTTKEKKSSDTPSASTAPAPTTT